MKHAVGLSILLLASGMVHAVDKSDFAFGYNLEVDGDGAIYSLTLPEDIYRGVTRADYGDLRVFNSRGDSVPHIIRREEKKITTPQAEIRLPFFPLYSSGEPHVAGQAIDNIRITTNEQGAVIDLNYGKTDPKTRKLSGYLLDASALENPPNALSVTWPDEQANFVIAVRVEGSDDLNKWHTLVASATLSHLKYGEHQLIQQRIELPVRKLKYLRISGDKAAALTLKEVLAQFPESINAQPRQWIAIPSAEVVVSDKQERLYVFDSKGFFPADQLALQLPQHNTVITGVLESSAKADGPWVSHYHGVLYDLQHEGTTLLTPEIKIHLQAHRYWRLRVAEGEASLNGLPTLRLGWVPEQLLFAAQGESPFLLAYGSAEVEPGAAVLGQLLHQDTINGNDQLIKPARLGAKIVLGDTAKLSPPPPPTPWKKWILWAVLVLGVILLATMAYRLVKQMNPAGKS